MNPSSNKNQLSETIFSSEWKSTRWNLQEQMQIRLGNDGYVHVQVVTQKLVDRILRALVKVISFGLGEIESKKIKDYYAIKTTFNEEQKELIARIVAQKEKNLATIKEEVGNSLYVFLKERARLRRPLPPPPPSIGSIREKVLAIQSDLAQLSPKVVNENVTIMGRLFDAGHGMALWLLPKLKNWEKQAQQYFSTPLPCPEEDNRDAAFQAQWQQKIENDYAELVQLLAHIPESEPLFGECQILKSQLEGLLKRFKWLDTYFLQCESLDAAMEKAGDQMMRLVKGKFNFSSEAYRAIVDQVKAMEKLAIEWPVSDELGKKKAERKCRYQVEEAYKHLDDLLESVTDRLKIEIDEGEAHLVGERSKKTLDQSKLLESQYFLEKLDADCAKFSEVVKEVSNKWVEVFARMRQKLKPLLAHTDPHPHHSHSKDLHVISRERSVLTYGKRVQLEQVRKAKHAESYSPLVGSAMRYFLLYLQAWDLFSPLTGKLINPIGKRDYNFYLSMMRKAHKEGSSDYNHYLELARNSPGADPDFLTMYDKYLKGQIQFQFEKLPKPIEGNLLAAGESGQIETAMEKYLPSVVKNWFSKFLGREAEQQVFGNASEFEKWAHYNLYPRFRDQYFDSLLDAFNRGEVKEPVKNSSPEEVLHYYFYKIFDHVRSGGAAQDSLFAELREKSPYSQLIGEFETFITAYRETHQSPIQSVSLSTLAQGKAVTKAMKSELQSLQASVSERSAVTEAREFIPELQSYQESLSKRHNALNELLERAPLDFASPTSVKTWLKEVEESRQLHLFDKQETRALLAAEFWKEAISLEKLKIFLNSSSEQPDEGILAHILGPQTSSLRGDSEKFESYRLHVLKTRLDLLKQNPLCSEKDLAEFCGEYLNNPSFVKRAKESPWIEYLETLVKEGFQNGEKAARFDFELHLKALHDYHRYYGMPYKGKVTRLLMQEAVTHLAAKLVKWGELGIINSQELAFTNQFLEEIRSSITQGRNISNQELAERRSIRLNEQSTSPAPPADFSHLLPEIHLESEPKSLNDFDLRSFSVGKEVIPNFERSQAGFVQDSAAFLNSITQAVKEKNYLNAEMAIHEFVKSIPMDRDGDRLYKYFDYNLEAAIALFHGLSKNYYLTLSHKGTIRLKPEAYFVQLKLMTLTDEILNRLYPDNPYCLRQESTSHTFNNAIFSIHDNEWVNQYKLMKSYWQNKSENGSQSDFEKLSNQIWFQYVDWATQWLFDPKQAQLVDYIDKEFINHFGVKPDHKELYIKYLIPEEKILIKDKKGIIREYIKSTNDPRLPNSIVQGRNIGLFTTALQIDGATIPPNQIDSWFSMVSQIALKNGTSNGILSFDVHESGYKTACEKYYQPGKYFREYERVEDPFVTHLGFKKKGIRKFLDKGFGRIGYSELTSYADYFVRYSATLNHKAYPIGLVRELLNVVAAPELQGQETVRFFTRNLLLFGRNEFQILFKELLLEQGVLQYELGKQPADNKKFVQDLSKLCRDAYTFYVGSRDFATASFLLEMNHLLSGHVAAIQRNHPSTFEGGFTPDFLEARKEWRRLLTLPDINDDMKAVLYRDLALSYKGQKVMSHDDAVELITSLMHYNIQPAPKELRQNETDEEMSRLLPSHRNMLLHVSSKNKTLGALLNSIYDHFHPNAPQLEWKTLTPSQFISHDGKVYIDLIGGVIKENGKEVVNIPSAIKAEPLFKLVFGDTKMHVATKIEGLPAHTEAYLMIGPQGRNYRVIKKGEEPIVIQADFDGKWYEWVGKETEINTLKVAPALHLDHYFWKNLETQTLVATQKGSLNWKYLLDKEGVHKVDSKGQKTDFSVASLQAQSICRFEQPEWTTVLEERNTHQVAAIYYPRYRLEFSRLTLNSDGVNAHKNIDSNQKLMSLQYPGFYLSEQQHLPEFDEEVRYIVLEKTLDSGTVQKIAIFPKLSVENEQAVGLEAIDHIKFEVSSKDQRTESERFFLGMLHLSAKNYNEAMRALGQSQVLNQGYSEDSMQALHWLVNIHDSNPQAASVKLKASALLLRNHAEFNSEKGEVFQVDRSELLETYLNYLNNLDKVKRIQLSQDDEKRIVVACLQDIDPIENEAHQIVVKRMGELNISVKNPLLKQKLGGEKSADDRPISFSKIRVEFLFQNKGSSIFSDTVFQERYDFIKKISSPEGVSWSELRDFTFSLPGTNYSFLALFMTRGVLMDILAKRLSALQTSKDKTQAISYLLLEALLHHPDKFPNDLRQLLESSSDRVISRRIKEYIVIPLQLLVMQEPNLQIHVGMIPNKELKNEGLAASRNTTFDVSINLRGDEVEPSLPKMPLFLTKEPASDKDIERLATIKSELSTLCQVNTTDAFMQKVFKKTDSQIQAFLKTINTPSSKYHIPSHQHLQNVRKELIGKSTKLGPWLKNQQEAIEALINKPCPSALDNQIRISKQIALQDAPITLKEAINALLRRDAAILHARNPTLSLEEVHRAQHMVKAYLINSIRQQRTEALIAMIDRLLILIKTNSNEYEIQDAIRELAEESVRDREFEIPDHPAYLVSEYYDAILLRKDQMEGLRSLMLKRDDYTSCEAASACSPRREPGETEGIAFEAKPGSGKTYVFMPQIGFINADGTHTAIGIAPKSLIEDISRKLEKQMGTSLNQVLVTMKFSRNTQFNLERLQGILENLKEVQEGRKYLLMASESVQALYLKMAEKFRDYNGIPSLYDRLEAKKELDLFREIFGHLKETGSVHFDEGDLIFNILMSFHFTVGHPNLINPVMVQVAEGLYSYLAKHPDVMHAFKFSDEAQQTFAKNKVIEAIWTQELELSDGEFEAYIRTLPNSEKELINRFFMGDTHKDVTQFMNSISNEKIQDIFALLKEELNVLLPLTLPKNLYEHFGPTTESVKETEDYIAFPRQQGRPAPVGTRFGTELEILNYTLQMYLEMGVPPALLKNEIEKIINEVKAELLRSHGKKPLEQLDAYQKLCKLIGEKRAIDLFSLTDADIDKMAHGLKNNPNGIIYLISKYVLPKIKIYENQLSADPLIYGVLFPEMQVQSGTLWNSDTFHRIITKITHSDTAGKTLFHLWRNSPANVTVVPKPTESTINDVLKNAVNSSENRPTSFIDAANLFRGISNELVAKELLKIAEENNWKDIKGVVFYGADDKRRLITHIDGRWEVVDFVEGMLSMNQLLVYWDQSHTTGSDFKLSAMMQAAVTIGRHSLFRDLIQAVWRLRGIEKSQVVRFVIADEDYPAIVAALEKVSGKKHQGSLTLKDLVSYTLMQQTSRQGNDNFRAFKQKMKSIVLERALRAMMEASDIDAAAEIFMACQSLFESTQKSRPYEIYGRSSQPLLKGDVVAKEVARFLHHPAVDAFKNNPLLNQNGEWEHIVEEVNALARDELAKLPDYIAQSDEYEKERNVQTQKEQSVEIEVEAEVDIETNRMEEESLGDHKHISNLRLFPNTPWQETTWVDMYSRATYDNPLIFPLQYILKKDYTDIATGFDKDLLASKNLCPFHEPTWMETYFHFKNYDRKDPHFQHIYFKNDRKDFNHVLVMEDKTTNGIKLVMLDHHDVTVWREKLLEGAKSEKPGDKRELRLALYDLTTGMYLQGQKDDRIDSVKLESNPAFQRLKVQAKFFQGERFYSKSEIKVLKEWMKSIGVDKAKEMERFYKYWVLEWRFMGGREYEKSDMAKVFKDKVA